MSDYAEDARYERSLIGKADICGACADGGKNHVCEYDGREFGCDCEGHDCKPWVTYDKDGFPVEPSAPVVPPDAVGELLEFFARLDAQEDRS